MNNISLSSYGSGQGWLPIGTSVQPFKGTLDGNGYVVKDLYINRPEDNNWDDVGLFGLVGGGNIINLGVEIAAGGITGYYSVGGIVGYLSGGKITNCYSKGNITGYSSVGGIAGYIRGDSEIKNSYSTANIIAGSLGGGITGRVHAGLGNLTKISNCYSTGNVTVTSSIGSAGGIVGEVTSFTGIITNSVAINTTITSNGYAGRIVGDIGSGEISNNFALDTMIASGEPFNTNQANHGIDKTEAELKMQSTYSVWNFGSNNNNPWKMPLGGGYPILYWQTE
jgi:hypothetical protein